MQGIADKVVVITGGTRGIGLATARMFLRYGAQVAVCGLDEHDGLVALEQFKADGGEAIFVQADVRSASDMERFIATAVERYGRLDFACNIAGITGAPTTIVDGLEDDWDAIMDTNVKGIWLAMKYELPHLLKQGKGAIVNMASVGGLVALKGFTVYTASKHAVIGLTKNAALDHATSGVRINAVCPAGVATELVERNMPEGSPAREGFVARHPIGRLAQPDEVASTILWLCSDHTSFVTGSAWTIDGAVSTI